MNTWIDRFPGLAPLSQEDRASLMQRAQVVRLPAGHVAFGRGDTAEHMILALSGSVKVSQVSETGREIVLYRVEAGEGCVLTTACLLGGDAYAAEGVTETEIDAVLIPKPTFDALLARSAAFRDFVFQAYGRRVADLFRVIDAVAFGRIDMRLAERLLDLAHEDEVHATHQTLATELGTAREVISRQLQEFQRRGWLTLSRGVIRLDDAAALAALTKG